MCVRYNITISSKATLSFLRVDSVTLTNRPVSGNVYPSGEGPILRSDAEGRREAAALIWGFPPPRGAGQPVLHVGNLKSPFWRGWLGKPAQRCLVPVDRFAGETVDPKTRRRKTVWFALKHGEPFAFAGVWRPGLSADAPSRYAFLTCMANSFVAAVHPKAMPVILAPADYDRWLTGSYDEIVPLARAYPSEEMTLVDA